MNLSVCLFITYLSMGTLLATVMGVSKLLNEHKNGTLKTMNRRDFLFMVILLMVAWPLLVMDRATRGE